MEYSVYCHTCLPNGKKYFGISNDPARRWKDGFGRKWGAGGYNPVLKKDYEIYGKEEFISEILLEGLTMEEACKKETELIKQYETYTNPSKGYNWSAGGEVPIGADLSMVPKRKAAMVAKYGVESWMQTKEGKENYSRVVAERGLTRPVQNVETGKVFPSIQSAASWAGLARDGHIGACLKGTRKTSGKVPKGFPNAGARASWRDITYEEYKTIANQASQ